MKPAGRATFAICSSSMSPLNPTAAAPAGAAAGVSPLETAGGGVVAPSGVAAVAGAPAGAAAVSVVAELTVAPLRLSCAGPVIVGSAAASVENALPSR